MKALLPGQSIVISGVRIKLIEQRGAVAIVPSKGDPVEKVRASASRSTPRTRPGRAPG
jgi:hypothetical protein